MVLPEDGVPTAVLLSMEHFEGLMETLDILSDQKTIDSLRKSLKQVQAGRWETQGSVFEDEKE